MTDAASGGPSTLTTGVCLSQKLLGAGVFAGCAVATIALLPGGAPAFTWVLLGIFGISSGLATIANFGERVTADATGIAQRNVFLAHVGIAGRRAAWTDVLGAVDQDRRTIFLDVRDQRRWVLDHIDGHEELRQRLVEEGVRVDDRARPRMTDVFRRERSPPG